MTWRLVIFLAYSVADIVCLASAALTSDPHKRHTRLLLAIYFALAALAKVVAAIAIHTGAFPLWNNK